MAQGLLLTTRQNLAQKIGPKFFFQALADEKFSLAPLAPLKIRHHLGGGGTPPPLKGAPPPNTHTLATVAALCSKIASATRPVVPWTGIFSCFQELVDLHSVANEGALEEALSVGMPRCTAP